MAIFSKESSIDIAAFIMLSAKEDNIEVSILKLHCLLFIFYGIYGVIHPFRKLMPVKFVTSNRGPIEKTLLVNLQNKNNVYPKIPSFSWMDHILLYRIWNRFSHHSEQYLIKKIINMPYYIPFHKQGPNTEIIHDSIIKNFIDQKSKFDTILTSNGKLVRQWIPKHYLATVVK